MEVTYKTAYLFFDASALMSDDRFMHRAPLLEKLSDYRPIDDHETEMAGRLHRFVTEHADCFERSLQIGHVTGSAWVMDRGRTHALLTHHLKLDKWLQLGGHADGDPDILRVAVREAREESNLEEIRVVSEAIFDVDIHMIPARGLEPQHLHYDVRFLLDADRATPLVASSESRSLAWVAMEKIAELNQEESVMRMVRKSRLY
jgi:8-oxo-dGTP pyrophosphatase MutT (NUDIX family)